MSSPYHQVNKMIDDGQYLAAQNELKTINKAEHQELNSKLEYLNIKSILAIKFGKYSEAREFNDTLQNLARTSGDIYFLISSKITKAEICIRFGDLNKSLEIIKETKEMFDSFKNDFTINKLLPKLYTIKGFYFLDSGEINNAIPVFRENIRRYDKVDDKIGSALCYNNIGLAYRMKGNLEDSLSNYFMSLKILKSLNCDYYVSLLLNNIGVIHRLRGNPDEALKYFLDSLELNRKFNSSPRLAGVLENIGIAHYQKGEHIPAYKKLTEALDIMKNIGNDLDTSYTLFYLLVVAISLKDLDKIDEHYRYLEQLNSNSNNKLINLRYQLIKALKLKNSKNIVDLAQALQIFEQITKEDIIIHEITILARISLCEIYLLEIRMFEDNSKISKVEEIVEKLVIDAQEQNSFVTLIQSLILKSRLYLIKNEFEEVFYILNQAILIARENGLESFIKQITEEEQFIVKELSKWENMNHKSVSTYFKIKNSKILEYLTEIRRFI